VTKNDMSATHRFFVHPGSVVENRVFFPDFMKRQLEKVLRMNSGDEITVLDGSGYRHTVSIETVGKNIESGLILDTYLGDSEPSIKVTLYQALIKHDNFEYVLQKGVELGISEFVPFTSSRTEFDIPSDSRFNRWRKIIREAAEQCGRDKLPEITYPLTIKQSLMESDPLSFIPWEEEKTCGLRDFLNRDKNALREAAAASIFIGPVGGFTFEEIQFAQDQGVIPVSLGKRVLRSETAGLVATTALLYEAGEMDA
jgi:16S rRNA (uracil1498-N3)-methyltransferase|tara:strand:- start:2451 stop:3215 length:765 start_codon:yes stop_codon:yes gene_type:complete